ncbi:DNA-3-methyladenine glycosylase family protein [Nesterenkonia haasae]|uniref:DNA-3-methyladenine glycosylase family protein n=1 Tax=Nesterenkonia haasae TaxID=2587813 RepID=UPI001F3FDFE3|nr:3-methyladenine DNA glycosylase [Nesterenkonia haasae]
MTSAAAHPRLVVDSEVHIDLYEPFDLPRTLGVLQRGYADPAIRVDPGAFSGGPRGTPGAGAWMALRQYDAAGRHLGAVTLRCDQLDTSRLRVYAVSESEKALNSALEMVPALLGAEDDWSEFELLLEALGGHISATLAQVRRRHPGVRLPATGALFDQLVTATLEQKVTHREARHGWRQLLRRHGDRAPTSASFGTPDWLRLPLTGVQLKRVPSWEWHRMWVQPPMSRTIQRLADRASSIHRLGASTPLETTRIGELAEQLTAISGVGQWTTAEALQRSHGSADLPAVGDYHLAHFVGEALTGKRTDDAGMLDLLESFRPHRQRVIRLLKLSGFRGERFGPRLAPEDHRAR